MEMGAPVNEDEDDALTWVDPLPRTESVRTEVGGLRGLPGLLLLLSAAWTPSGLSDRDACRLLS